MKLNNAPEVQERSVESNEINLESINNSPIQLIRSWLNKFEQNKLEYYSVIFGISGLSFIAFGICVLILILTTYEHHSTNRINCSIINVTHTHVKLCSSNRCRIFNDCIPYVCTIIFVRYQDKNIFYESKLFSSNNYLNSSCSYEPTFCISRSRIQFEQITFLKQYLLNISQINQCCLHSITQQPIICPNSLNSIYYSLIILCFFIGLILILIGIITQLHLNDYLKSSDKPKENFLDTILNFHFSTGTIRSSIERITPVNYDILTQTISRHTTPSTITKFYPNDNLLLFDIEEENQSENDFQQQTR